MDIETKAGQSAAAFAGHRPEEELSPLLAWLTDPRVYTARGRAAPSRAEALIDRLCAHIRRHPLQSVIVAAFGGFLAGTLWMRV